MCIGEALLDHLEEIFQISPNSSAENYSWWVIFAIANLAQASEISEVYIYNSNQYFTAAKLQQYTVWPIYCILFI